MKKSTAVGSLSPTIEIDRRLDLDTYALCLAFVASLRSEDPHHRVGAVGLTKRGRVIGTGYNGLPTGQKLGRVVDDDWRLANFVHAEENLVSLTPPNALQTVAVTTLPCSSCAKLLVAHGVERVVYGQVYHRDPRSLEILKWNKISLIHLPLQEILALIHKVQLKPRDLSNCATRSSSSSSTKSASGSRRRRN